MAAAGPVDDFRAGARRYRRAKLRAVTAVELLVLLGGSAWGAYYLVSTRKPHSTAAVLDVTAGAVTPGAAVGALLGDLDRSDLEAAMTTIVPGEQTAIEPELESLLGQLQRLDVLSPAASLSDVSGLGLSFSGV
ncbi:MAG TPA: hypothetical protein VMD59_11690, partial [Acidimicrobiales bacterium]|nr:hypothetical protein [Acidimicrobiales bacterium]